MREENEFGDVLVMEDEDDGDEDFGDGEGDDEDFGDEGQDADTFFH